tara:strand:- start:5171 stop:6889 length:1719 start_codon:yes stop_codon:yes gene_type:complete
MLSKLKFILNDKEDIWKIIVIFIGSLLAAISEIISIGSIPLFITLLFDPELFQSKLSDYVDISFLFNLERSELILLGGIFLMIIFVIKNLFLMILIFFQSKVIRDFNVKLTNKLYKLYLYAPYFIHLKKNNAELVRNIIGETSQVISAILKVMTLFRELLVLIFVFLLVLYVDVLITLFIFSILSACAAIFFYITRKTIHKNAKHIQDLSASRIKSVNETFGAIKEVKIFNIEKIFNKKFFSMNLLREHYYFVNSFLTSIPRHFLETIIVFTLIFVLMLYNYFEKDFNSLLPLLTLLSVAAIRLLPSFNSISQSLSSIKSLAPSINLVINEIQTLEKIENKKKFLQNENFLFKKKIEFNNVSFKYPGNSSNTLSDINLEILLNSKVAIIGSSGAGKTTFINLLLGLLKPSAGSILVDGRNIEENLKVWQSIIGYVPQDIYLMDDTIKNNITFNEEIVDDKQLEKILKLSRLDSFVNSLPNGLETYVGERGTRISGGQRQRIGIARALFKDPKVIIFDEATNALDNENENKIMNEILALDIKKNLIIITHKHELVKACNKVFTFDGGRLIQQD